MRPSSCWKSKLTSWQLCFCAMPFACSTVLLSALSESAVFTTTNVSRNILSLRDCSSCKSFCASVPYVARSLGSMSMSYPLLTAFFCSCIFVAFNSVSLRFTVLMALSWSSALTYIDTTSELSISSKSASRRSFSSGARMFKNDTAPYFAPILKCLLDANSKLLGAMKSLTLKPLGASKSHENLNCSCPSMWKMPCISASLARPSNGSALTPSLRKLLRMSVSRRSKRGFAVLYPSASMPNVRYLFLMRPLLPRSSWSCSILEYSARRLSSSSPRRGMAMRSR